MVQITCIENFIDKDQNHYGNFVLEPLELGQGITLGNALRRTLLSDLSGYGISRIRINNIKHEFTVMDGLREDVLELCLNLKEVLFKPSFILEKEKKNQQFLGFLHVKGPRVITAGMFCLPKNYFTILNPNLYLGTLLTNTELYLDILIEKGKGYKLNEEKKKEEKGNFFSSDFPSNLYLDTIYLPIKKVNYKVKLIHDTKGNIKESLNIEIFTNGSITPKRALQESMKILLNLFSSLFIGENFLKISTNFSSFDKINYKKKNNDDEN